MGQLKKRLRAKKSADNEFTRFTGLRVTKLTGNSDCWICHEKASKTVPVRKISYAVHQNWSPMHMPATARRMKLLRVKQTCGVDQCVNPDHLVGVEKEYNPWG